MNWSQPTTGQKGAITIPADWLFIHYYEALNILFRVENALRIFVYSVLKNEHFDKWTSLSISSDEEQQSTIAAIAKRRQNQAGDFGYLCFPISCPIMHLTSGELIRLMLSENEWPRFKPFFLGSKEIIRTKLDEIGCIRNSLAHFRPLKSDDVEVLKQNARQVLSRIEEKLDQMLTCPNTTPTNTTESWYTELRTLGTDVCQLGFKQSQDSEWITIVMTYKPVVISKNVHPSGGHFRVLKIKTPQLLRAAPTITKFVTFLSEDITWPGKIENPKFAKTCRLVFRRAILSEHHTDVKKELEELMRRISEESDLIGQDNLAGGELVEGCSVSGTVEEIEPGRNYVDWTLNRLQSPTSEDDPPEYWGELPYFFRDYISSAPIFPWMPTAFASESF